jgi:hypothetical protein
MIREYLLEASQGICELCGKALSIAEATLDHIIPKSLGGPDALENLQIAHFSCNTRRGNMPLEQWQELLSQGDMLESIIGPKRQKENYYNRTGRKRGRI